MRLIRRLRLTNATRVLESKFVKASALLPTARAMSKLPFADIKAWVSVSTPMVRLPAVVALALVPTAKAVPKRPPVALAVALLPIATAMSAKVLVQPFPMLRPLTDRQVALAAVAVPRESMRPTPPPSAGRLAARCIHS